MTEPITSQQFLTALFAEVFADQQQVQTGNTDYVRFPREAPAGWQKIKHRVKEQLVRAASARGFVYTNRGAAASMAGRLARITAEADRFAAFYRSLGDEYSREWMIKLLAFSVLGKERVRLPRNNADFWSAVERVESLVRQPRSLMPTRADWHLDLYDLETIGAPVKLHAHRLNILDTFLLEQYRFDHGGVEIAAVPGDVVLDGGGCWGDSALYFAHRVGPQGRVLCFEFLPSNLSIFEQNLGLNRELAERIETVPKALWERSGERVAYTEQGPGTALRAGSNGEGPAAETVSIDDIVAERDLARVDLIKLDIEGAELAALHGAEKTIRRFRPKLAIAVYHSWDDFITIPPFIAGLGLGYEFYLDHFTIHEEETVLFCRPQHQEA